MRKKRKKHGGSGRKLFIEGWIEFKDKRVAKAVALSLNNTTIGNDINWFATILGDPGADSGSKGKSKRAEK